MRSTPLSTDPAGAPPPDAFGPFRVLHQIGAGELGPVFRAYDPDQDRLVAVKWFQVDLKPAQAQDLADRLRRLIAADLAHPAIITPIASGVVERRVYLAQDFAAADSLEVVGRDFGATRRTDIAHIAAQVAAALDFAAASGTLHGALHPRDVLVASGDARITGLGVVQALGDLGIQTPVRPPYAAPERVAGREWDARADQYSLAAIVAEMLAGATAPGAGGGTSGGTLDRDRLQAVLARAMADRPADRFPNAQAFADALVDVVGLSSGDTTVGATLVVPGPKPSSSRHAIASETAARLPLDDAPRGVGEAWLPGDAPPPPLDAGAVFDDTASWDAAITREAGTALDPDLTLAVSPDATAHMPGTGRLDFELRPDPGATDAVASVDMGEGPARALDLAAAPPDAPAASPSDVTVTAMLPPGSRGPRGLLPVGDASASATPSTPAVWPIPLALMVGVVVGVAIGFFVFGDRTHGDPAAVATVVETPQVATSGAVPAPPSARADGIVQTPAPAPTGPSSGTSPDPVATAPAPAPAAPTPTPAPARPVAEAVAGSASDHPSDRSAQARGRLLVRSSPAGARVHLDGKDVGATPLTLRAVALGVHTLRLVRAGYGVEERRVALSSSQPAQSLEVDLAREPAVARRGADTAATLSVESRPAGAAVFLDGRRIGRTPLTVDVVAVGSHQVRLELDGYRRWSSAVRVTAGERNRVTASLEQAGAQ